MGGLIFYVSILRLGKEQIIMKRYGYHRTSTREQHLDRGIKEITVYCEQNGLELEKIFTDQQTGKNFNRPRYQVLKEDVYIRKMTLNGYVIIPEWPNPDFYLHRERIKQLYKELYKTENIEKFRSIIISIERNATA